MLIECDTGGKRCGVQTPEAAALAEFVTAQPDLRFIGILTYPATGGATAVESFIVRTVALLKEKGMECPVRSSGGSPDLFSAARFRRFFSWTAARCRALVTTWRIGLFPEHFDLSNELYSAPVRRLREGLRTPMKIFGKNWTKKINYMNARIFLKYD